MILYCVIIEKIHQLEVSFHSFLHSDRLIDNIYADENSAKRRIERLRERGKTAYLYKKNMKGKIDPKEFYDTFNHVLGRRTCVFIDTSTRR